MLVMFAAPELRLAADLNNRARRDIRTGSGPTPWTNPTSTFTSPFQSPRKRTPPTRSSGCRDAVHVAPDPWTNISFASDPPSVDRSRPLWPSPSRQSATVWCNRSSWTFRRRRSTHAQTEMAATAASAGCSSGFRVSGNGRNRKDTSRSSAIRRTAYSATIFRRSSASPGLPNHRKSRNSSESWSTSRSSNSTPTGRKNPSPRASPDSVPFPINWNTSTCTTCCRCKVMLKYRLHRWRGILFNHSSCTSSSNIPHNGINSRGSSRCSQKFKTAAAGA